MRKKFLVFTIAIIQIYYLSLWLRCKAFSDNLRFSFFDVQLKLVEFIHSDPHINSMVVRIYHNKFELTTEQIIKHYINFWDIRFGILFFSLVGYAGIFLGFWYLLKGKLKYKWVLFSVLLLLPLIVVFNTLKSFILLLFILFIPLQAFSLFGSWNYLKKHKKVGESLIAILEIVSVIQVVYFTSGFLQFCIQR